jgi:hypothetical protein
MKPSVDETTRRWQRPAQHRGKTRDAMPFLWMAYARAKRGALQAAQGVQLVSVHAHTHTRTEGCTTTYAFH